MPSSPAASSLSFSAHLAAASAAARAESGGDDGAADENPGKGGDLIKLNDGDAARPIVTSAARSPTVVPALLAFKLGG